MPRYGTNSFLSLPGYCWLDPLVKTMWLKMQQRLPRYSIERPVEFRLRGQGATHNGEGQTLNISRGGVLFQTQGELPVGRKIELVVHLGDALGGPPVTLSVQGVVLRNQSGSVAVLIRKYRLRPVEELSVN